MIFISHKNDPDHECAYMIAQKLTENGITCWIAPESIQKGADFAEEIVSAINNCEIFVLVMTKETHKSQHVRMELKFAKDRNKTIIPLQIGKFDIDDVLSYLIGTIDMKRFDFTDEDFSDLIDRCKNGERIVNMEIGKNPKRYLSLIKGDVQDNMDYIISNHADELKNTVFAMGIDVSSLLRLSTDGGMLKWAVSYIIKRCNTNMDELQELINQAKVSQLHHKDGNQKMRFKDSVLIKIPVLIDKNRKEFIQLLLIATSKKKEDANGDKNQVEGIDTREIILEVFDRCDKLGEQAQNLFIGAMGTNMLKFPYEVSTAEILNCFVYAKRRGREMEEVHYPLKLWFSVRQIDMEKWELTVDTVLNYISTVVKFFKD
ncbi:MAG: toll/interleukin-1 receptor domain-containing protein [Christensenellales bacterium]